MNEVVQKSRRKEKKMKIKKQKSNENDYFLIYDTLFLQIIIHFTDNFIIFFLNFSTITF